MAKNSKNNKKRPTGQTGRPAGTTKPSSSVGSGSASSAGTSSGGASGSTSAGGAVTTTTTTVRDVQWERRKAWPLLLGSAAALTGLGVANYSWANPDGRLTTKAQDALSAKFPGAEVRVHGRDAIITGLPAGADVDAAHDLVRDIEGVRNVKEELAGLTADAPAETDAADTVAAETIAAETVAAETVAAETAAAETAAADTAAPETVAAPAVAADTAPAETVPATDAPETTAAPTTEAPTTAVAPTTEAPTTTVAKAPSTTVAPAARAEAAPAAAVDAPPVKIQFDSVSAEIVGDSQTSVDQLIAYLDANPDVRIKVVGHADNQGTRLTNLAISRARADAVVTSLVGAGIDRARISAFAQGDRLPVESNATAEGRRANRRVDIVFFGAEGTGDREVAFTG